MIREVKLEECAILDDFLTKLLVSEKEYDSNINDKYVFKNFYEKIWGRDNIKLLVKLVDDKIVGYLYGYIIEDEVLVNRIAVLDSLYILEEYRKHGYSKELIHEFKKYCTDKGVSTIEVKVLTSNDAAMNLYSSENFVENKKVLYLDNF